MKKLVSIMVMALCTLTISAQEESETTTPLWDMEVVRKVDCLDIEGAIYRNVEVALKSISPDYLISDKSKVKVTIVDKNGKKIWKKTLKGVYLYVFKSGQVEVAKKNFRPIIIWRSSLTDETNGIIREREGVY
jgi:hypothetical protein